MGPVPAPRGRFEDGFRVWLLAAGRPVGPRERASHWLVWRRKHDLGKQQDAGLAAIPVWALAVRFLAWSGPVGGPAGFDVPYLLAPVEGRRRRRQAEWPHRRPPIASNPHQPVGRERRVSASPERCEPRILPSVVSRYLMGIAVPFPHRHYFYPLLPLLPTAVTAVTRSDSNSEAGGPCETEPWPP
jgi:hypothetical protein